VTRILAVALVTAGIVMPVDAGLTLAWKEPVSAVYSSFQQRQAESQFEELRDGFLAVEDLKGPEPSSPAAVNRRAKQLADRLASQLPEGEGIGRIDAPSMNADYTVLEGTHTATLQGGPGHYPETKLPGQGGTVGIAGHRTTYGAPFRRIDKIEVGDEITVEMPYTTFTYEVTNTRIVKPSDVQIVRDVGRERLVLTACHPLYSAEERYAIFADLAEVELAAG
jgi:sortase A